MKGTIAAMLILLALGVLGAILIGWMVVRAFERVQL